MSGRARTPVPDSKRAPVENEKAGLGKDMKAGVQTLSSTHSRPFAAEAKESPPSQASDASDLLDTYLQRRQADLAGEQPGVSPRPPVASEPPAVIPGTPAMRAETPSPDPRGLPTTTGAGDNIQRVSGIQAPIEPMPAAGVQPSMPTGPVARQPHDSEVVLQAAGGIVQRTEGTEIQMEVLKSYATLATRGYTLVCKQTEVAKAQVQMLDFYTSGLEGSQLLTSEAEATIDTAKAKVEETAKSVKTEISKYPEVALRQEATVKALYETSSVVLEESFLAKRVVQSLKSLAELSKVQTLMTSALVDMEKQAVSLAKIALEVSETHMMRGFLQVADALAAELAEGDREVKELQSLDVVSSSTKEKFSLATTVSDGLNNATTGVAFGAVGALDAGNAFNLSSALATAMGVIGGVLGIFFGAIGTFLGVKNAVLGAVKKEELKAAKSKLSNESVEDIADYAIGQKGKKTGRNVAVAVAGLTAIAAGTIGLVALSVSTLGVAAIVAGIAAALIGLGFLGFRMVRNWWKRRSERKEFAAELIAQIEDDGENAAQAKEIVRNVGLDPTHAGEAAFRKSLESKIGGYVKSKRTQMAEGLVKSLIAGKPSEVFDAELVLNALGVDPAWVRQSVEGDKVNAAVSKVASKMASW